MVVAGAGARGCVNDGEKQPEEKRESFRKRGAESSYRKEKGSQKITKISNLAIILKRWRVIKII